MNGVTLVRCHETLNLSLYSVWSDLVRLLLSHISISWQQVDNCICSCLSQLTCTNVYVCMYVCMYVCVCVCVRARVWIKHYLLETLQALLDSNRINGHKIPCSEMNCRQSHSRQIRHWHNRACRTSPLFCAPLS